MSRVPELDDASAQAADRRDNLHAMLVVVAGIVALAIFSSLMIVGSSGDQRASEPEKTPASFVSDTAGDV